MMNNPFNDELLSGYLDNELSEEERADVELLIQQNEDAAELFKQLKSQSDELNSLSKFQLPDDWLFNCLNNSAASSFCWISNSTSARSSSDNSLS
ncbi:MAG: zf-HC2 domain-containing protein, partial [Planctomycetota bacterium]